MTLVAKIAYSGRSWAISLTVFATIARAASLVTRVFPESIYGTLLIAGSEQGIMDID
jgi:hypothetical protein